MAVRVHRGTACIVLKGGPGSGHHGHHGIPGQRGGSLPGTGLQWKPPDEYGDAPWLNYNRDMYKGHMRRYLSGKGPENLYHVTDTDNMESIAEHGLIPGAERAPGQSWEATHSRYATYFHGDSVAAAGNVEQSEPKGGYGIVVAKPPRTREFTSRILPDEDVSLTPHDGLRTFLKGEPVAIIAGMERQNIEGFVLDTKVNKRMAASLKKMGYAVWDFGKWERKERPQAIIRVKGGPGSGHHGHRGIPGKRGGSLPGAGAMVGTVMDPKSVGKPGLHTYNEDLLQDMDEWSKKNRSSDIRNIGVYEESASIVTPNDAKKVYEHWENVTSNGNDIRSLSLQEAAAEELGGELSRWQTEKLESVRNSIAAGKPRYSNVDGGVLPTEPLMDSGRERALIRATYDRTQAMLSDTDQETITVYRGAIYDLSTHGDVQYDDTLPYKGNMMESWSFDPFSADGFASGEAIGMPPGYSLAEEGKVGIVLRMEVPVRNVISTYASGFGNATENEAVIWGSGDNEVFVQEVYE